MKLLFLLRKKTYGVVDRKYAYIATIIEMLKSTHLHN
jgi:hypothetical protein